MTLKQATDTVRSLGLSLSKRDGEYRVRIPGNPDADYFTDDMEDAVSTAAAMARDARNRTAVYPPFLNGTTFKPNTLLGPIELATDRFIWSAELHDGSRRILHCNRRGLISKVEVSL